MIQKPSSPSFADMFLGQRKVKQTFFSQIDQIVDWNPIRGILEIIYTKGYKSTGRPSYDSLVLFKTELLRTWYELSDGEVEEQVNDRLSFSRFVGLGMKDTPRRPRGRKEYEVVEDRNEENGQDASEDAMLKEIFKPNVDGEARWVKKMGKLHFGYKRHTVTDENGLVLAEETTAANESDIKHLETPMEKANLPQRTPVYADKDYDSAENRRALGKMKLKSRIIHKGTRARKITERERRINVAISKVRYRVERTFGSIHRWFLGGVEKYVGLAKKHAQHMMEAMAYSLYRVPGIIVSNSFK